MYTLGIDAFSSRKERTGVEWYTYHLLRAMKKETPDNWGVFLYARDQDDFTADISHASWQWKSLRWPPRRAWGHIRLSWEMMRNPVNTLFVPAAMIPLVHPHRPWRKQWTITTIHDAEFLSHPEQYASQDRRRQTMALSFAANHAARVLVPSEAVKKSLEHILSEEQVRVIPLGIDHAHYHQSRDDAYRELLVSKYHLTRPYLLYVGRVDAKKNVLELIEAFAAYRRKYPEGAQILVLAGGFGFQAERIPEKIKKLHLADAVQCLGYVPEADLPALYHGARAFVFPSAHEGFGLPVVQALACGTPTIVADTPIMHEVAGEAAMFVDVARADAWADAVEAWVADASCHERGFAQSQKFSWDRTAAQTWQEIKNLVK